MTSPLASKLPGLLQAVAACLPRTDMVRTDLPTIAHSACMSELLHAVRMLEGEYTAECGPLASWRTPWADGLFERLDVRVVMLDDELGWDAPAEEIVDVGDEVDFADGNLVAFAILHDRDNDGEAESLAHLWTARSLRRHGYARQVLVRARERFPLREVEGPLTRDGHAFVRSVAADLLEPASRETT